MDDFAGITSLSYAVSMSDIFYKENWIIDTEASNHICSNFDLLIKPQKINDIKPVSLPDGTVKYVTHIGDIKMNDKITLTNALFVPSFKYNLLFVNRLSETALLRVIFYPHYCLL